VPLLLSSEPGSAGLTHDSLVVVLSFASTSASKPMCASSLLRSSVDSRELLLSARYCSATLSTSNASGSLRSSQGFSVMKKKALNVVFTVLRKSKPTTLVTWATPGVLSSACSTLRAASPVRLDYIDWEGRCYFSQEDGNVIKGIPHNRFLVTALQAMGLSPADYERDGKPGYGATSTNGRDPGAWPTDYDLSTIGQILPGIQGQAAEIVRRAELWGAGFAPLPWSCIRAKPSLLKCLRLDAEAELLVR
jgi:hypothetical protein